MNRSDLYVFSRGHDTLATCYAYVIFLFLNILSNDCLNLNPEREGGLGVKGLEKKN